MNYVIAGAISGLVLAAASIAIGPIMLFTLATDPPRPYRALLGRVSPMTLMMGGVVLAYPVWILVGAVLGLIYRASETVSPGGGLGSPNLAYTVAVLVGAAAAAVPLAVLLRRVVYWLVGLTLVFVGAFGWLLPHLAAR